MFVSLLIAGSSRLEQESRSEVLQCGEPGPFDGRGPFRMVAVEPFQLICLRLTDVVSGVAGRVPRARQALSVAASFPWLSR